MTQALDALFDSLQRRLRPEDVAELVLSELGPDLSSSERRLLEKAAGGSLKRWLFKFTSMAQDFHRPVPPARQARKAGELFATAYPLSDADCADVEKVGALVRRLADEIRKVEEKSDFKQDRLDRKRRKSAGLEISRRRYNKLFRFVCRIERKLETYRLELRKYSATRVAKSSLATRLRRSDFAASRDAACFIAYFTARCNRRSVFTNQSQDRPYDDVAAMLLDRFKRNPCPEGWRAVAHVMPDVDVVKYLYDADKMDLFGSWTAVLRDISDLLRRTWERSRFNRATMTVSRGDDSSTWNALAGAWNAARQGWLGLVYALGMEALLERACFGKVMRLMAADVAAWHRASGKALEPDTAVWAELPPPWEVFSGEAACALLQVEQVCRKHGVDPEKKGWAFPRTGRMPVPFLPTPELVHGVVVAHPQLATILRKLGWFSGKEARPLPPETGPVILHRDPTGAALGVELAPDAAADGEEAGLPERPREGEPHREQD